MNTNSTTLLQKKLLLVLGVSFPSVLVAVFLLEILVRLLLPVSDTPDVYFNSQLGISFTPNQSGRYVKGSNREINAEYRINQDGWNSPKEYQEEKNPNILRIAAIGDSYIEALQVNPEKSYPYLLEKLINQTNTKTEVYTFGHSGANLTHYIYIAKYVINKYHPDLILINIVGNDFDESIYGFSRKDNWSLMINNQSFTQIPPKQVSNLSIKQVLKHSALIRYLTINLDLVNNSKLINYLFYADTRKYDHSTDKTKSVLTDESLNLLTSYLAAQINDLASISQTPIILVVDGDRNNIYGDRLAQPDRNVSKYFNSMIKAANQFNIPALDLHPILSQQWSYGHKYFEWSQDEHWNQHGHRTIAQAAFNFLISNHFLDPR